MEPAKSRFIWNQQNKRLYGTSKINVYMEPDKINVYMEPAK